MPAARRAHSLTFTILMLTSLLAPLAGATSTGVPVLTDALGDATGDAGAASDILALRASSDATHVQLRLVVEDAADHVKLIHYRVAFAIGSTSYVAFTSYQVAGTLTSSYLQQGGTLAPIGASFEGDTLVLTIARIDLGSPAEGTRLTGLGATTKQGSSGATFDVTSTASYRLGNNGVPTIDPIGDVTLAETGTLTIPVVASDSDGDALTVTTTTLPSFVAFAGGTFSVTPHYEDASPTPYSITVTATDGDNAATETFSILVTNLNRVPAIAPLDDASILEAQTIAFTVAATDADGQAVTLGASGLPTDAAWDAATGAFDWTPSYDAASPTAYTLVFSATDGEDTSTESVAILVGDNDRAPAIADVADPTVAEQQAVSFVVAASDPDTGQVPALSASGVPADASWDAATGAFDWSPGFAAGGQTYAIVFTATSGPLTDTEVVTITVSDVLRAPSLDVPADTGFTELSARTLQLAATDPDTLTDGETLTFSATGLPQGASLDGATGALAWTPTYRQAGSYAVVLTVTDSDGLSDSESATLVVADTNRAPVLQVTGATAGSEEQLLSLAASASDLDDDKPTPVLTAEPLPAGATFDAASGAFAWTPTFEQAGAYLVWFNATDSSGDVDTELVTLSIGNVNRAPVMTAPATVAVAEAEAMRLTVSASDADGDAITLSHGALPAGAVVCATGAATIDVCWTPAYEQAGAFMLTFTATDAGTPALDDEASVLVQVANTNRAPTIGLSAGSTFQVDEGQVVAFGVSTSDADGQTVSLSASGVPVGASWSAVSGAFSWTPGNLDEGTHTLTFTAIDDDAMPLSDVESVTIVVGNVNLAPQLAGIGDKTVAELATLAFTVSGSDADTDKPAPTLAWSGLDGATFDVATGAFRWTPGIFAEGSHGVTFWLNDSLGASDMETVSIAVTNTNQEPTLDPIGAKSVAELSELTFIVTGSDADTDKPLPTIMMVAGPLGSEFEIGANVFRWTPGIFAEGEHEATFRIVDHLGASADQTIAITVANTNQVPSIADIAPGNVAEGDILQLVVVADDADTDKPAPTLAWSGLTGATFDVATGAFAYEPGYFDAGPHAVTFTVTDSFGATDSTTLDIIVANTNRAPSLAAIADATLNEGDPLAFQVAGSDPDTDAPAPILGVSGKPAGAAFVDGAFSWTPTFDDAGSFVLTFSITDGQLSDSETMTITIVDVNLPPVLASIADVTLPEDQPLALTLSASDHDGNPLSFSLAGMPAGAAFDAQTGALAWTPSFTQAGVYHLTASVDDGVGGTDAQAFTVTVTNVNRAPVVHAGADVTLVEGGSLARALSIVDADALDSHNVTVTGLPAGASYDDATRTLSWTTTFRQVGDYAIVFSVSDGYVVVEDALAIRVDEYAAPLLYVNGSNFVLEGGAFALSIEASDADGDTLAFSATGLPENATLDPSTGAFAWTTNAFESGEYSVTFVVSDGALAATRTLTLIVLEDNGAPVLAPIGPRSTLEQTHLTFSIDAADPDNDALSYLATGLPPGATFDAATRAFAWTPTYAQSGTYAVTFTVTDGGFEDSETVSIAVGNVNRAPMLVGVEDVAIAEQQAFTLAVSAADPDGDATTVTASGVPSGATFVDGMLSWTPGFEDAGSYTVTFTASDGDLSATSSATITVAHVNRAPTLAAIGARTVGEAATLAFSVSASDADGDALSFSTSALPAGAAFDSQARAFTWTPGFTQAGTYTVRFVVSDGALDASEDVSIVVTDVNRAPTLDAVGDLLAVEGAPLTATLTATDADGDSVTFAASGLPAGATLDALTGQLSWTPTFEQAAAYPVTLRASDGSLEDVESITITVANVNRAPVLAPIGAKNVEESAQLAFVVTASDPDGDVVTLAATGLPAGASFDAATGTFAWTPTYEDAGARVVTFSASDGDLGDAEAVEIAVGDVNRAPVLAAVGDRVGAEAALVTFAVTATDADGDAVTVSASGLPVGASFDGVTFTWTPGYDQSGPHTVTFTAADALATDSETVTLLIAHTNRAPVLAPIGAQATAEATELAFVLAAVDDDGDALTFSMTGAPAGATLEGARFAWTPGYADAGSYVVTFRVSDGSLLDEESVTLTVGNVNRAPILGAIGDKQVGEAATLSFSVGATDADGEAVTLSVGALPAGATLTDAAFSWTPGYDQAGSYGLTFTATDGDLSDSETIVISVVHVNRPPVLDAIGDKTGAETQTLSFVLAAADPDGDALAFEATALPAGASFDAPTRTFTWTPGYADAGTFAATFRASDGVLYDEESIIITIGNVNRPPVLGAIGDRTVAEGASLAIDVSASDIDGDGVTLSVTGAPAGSTFGDGVFSWWPGYEAAGTYAVTFAASDGDLTDSETVTITVAPTNRAPTLDAIPDTTLAEATALALHPSAADADGDALTFTVAPLPPGASYDAQTGALSWMPDHDQSGTYALTFTVSDGALSASRDVVVTVTNVNRAPLLDAIGAKAVDEAASLAFAVRAFDPDAGSVLGYTATDLPQGATFDTTTGAFAWTPTYEQSGTYAVTFQVADEGGLADSEAASIVVAHVNRAPVLDATADSTFVEGETREVIVTAHDLDAEDDVTLGIVLQVSGELPAGATFDATSGTFRWTPTFTQGFDGAYTFAISASDGTTTTYDYADFTVLNVNRAPVLDDVADATVDEGQLLSFVVTGSDADTDRPAPTLAVTALPPGATFDAQTGAFTWTPGAFAEGIHEVTFTLSDGETSDADTISIVVTHVNRAPVLAPIGPQAVAEDQVLAFAVTAEDPDTDKPSPTIGATGLPPGATFADGSFSWKPTFEQGGVYDVTFCANDGVAEPVCETIAITVGNVNRAPILDAIGDKQVGEAVALLFVVGASDADGDAVTITAATLPPGATFDGATLSWTPTYEQSGTYSVTFEVEDTAGLTDSETVTIVVEHVNRAPMLGEVADASVEEGALLAFTVAGSDPDVEDAAVLELREGPVGAAFDAATGAFSWTPGFDDSGGHPATFCVGDGALDDCETILITVEHVNRAPVLDGIGSQATAEAATLAFTVSGADPDVEDEPSLRADGLPAGATFDATTGAFAWTPTYDDAGTYAVTFCLADAVLEDCETVEIVVTHVNRAPGLVGLRDFAVGENQTLAFAVGAWDPDGDAVTLSLAEAPARSTFDPATGEFAWTPNFLEAGTYELTFRADDGGLATTGLVTIVVGETPNAPPTFDVELPARVTVLDTFSFAVVNVMDPEGAGGVEFEWDFDASDGFQAQRNGTAGTFAASRVGVLNVTVRATDADGMRTERVVQLEVDDFVTLDISVVVPPSRTDSGIGRVSVRGWDGTVLKNLTVQVRTMYAPGGAAGPQMEMRAFEVRIGASGTATFLLPRDTPLGNLPGGHMLAGSVTVDGTTLGDAEQDEGQVAYDV